MDPIKLMARSQEMYSTYNPAGGGLTRHMCQLNVELSVAAPVAVDPVLSNPPRLNKAARVENEDAELS